MKKEIKENLFLRIDPSPHYLHIGKVKIDCENGRVEFEEGYNPDETAKDFWGFIGRYKPKFIEQARQQERERIIEEIRVRKKVLKELIGKFNLDIDKHRLDELEQIENILTPFNQ